MNCLKNTFFFVIGLLALGLACARHRLQGYNQPTDFTASDWPRSILHVRNIVDDWRASLTQRAGRTGSVRDLRVLELGPGATLGTGILLAGLGVDSYRAVDAFPLAAATPADFYRALTASDLPPQFDRLRMQAAIDDLEKGSGALVGYMVDPDFDIVRSARGRRFDLIVSNAAFEHFEDMGRIIDQISEVAAPGAVFLAMVDFQTHSRWIRRADPNNIYRYSDRLYRLLAFPGRPNRGRPDDYVLHLTHSGWRNARVYAVDVATSDYIALAHARLHRNFRAKARRMDVLTGVVVAERPSL